MEARGEPTAVRGIVGRDTELAAIRNFLEQDDPCAAALVMTGDAGVGKTTLWRASTTLAAARGWRVLACRPAGAEVTASLSALADLLDPVLDDALPHLAEPQRRALEVALLRRADSDETLDHRSLWRGVLEALRSLANAGPLLVAIDDAQWLDPASAAALRFAIRRLGTEPILLIVASRLGDEPVDPLDLEGSILPERLIVQPILGLDVDDLARLLRSRLDLNLSLPAVQQLHRTSGGNPFYALEIGRALQRDAIPWSLGEPLPLPRTLRQLVERRLSALSDRALEVLLVASAVPRPTRALVAAAVRSDERADLGLAESERAEVIEIRRQMITFAHPLLASTVYLGTPLSERRRLHRRLSKLVRDPEERARHLALGAEVRDAGVAVALEEAAQQASRRGATDGAAQLLEQALAAVPHDALALRRRLLLAASHAYEHAGAFVRARDLVQEAVGLAEPGNERAGLLYQLAEMTFMLSGRHAAERIHQQALADAHDDPAVGAAVHRELAYYSMVGGNPKVAQAHASSALELAERSNDPIGLMRTLEYCAKLFFDYGFDQAEELMRRALKLEDQYPDALDPDDRPSTTRAKQLVWSDQLAEARPLLQQLVEDGLRAGDQGGRLAAHWVLGQLECYAGNLEAAKRNADLAYDLAIQTERTGDLGAILFCRALVHAHMGLVDQARDFARNGLARAEAAGTHLATIRNLGVLGFIDVSLGRFEAAHDPLVRGAELIRTHALGEPGFFRLIPDHVETQLVLSEFNEAERWIAWLEERGHARGRPWALGTAARGQALLEAARGRIETAVSHAQGSVRLLENFGQPFELARSLLVQGILERRSNMRRSARASLTTSLAICERIGSPLWAAKARGELGRIGGRAGGATELTPTERAVAEQVVAGLRNREIAERLFVSVRTVEANLSRVYVKLGVRSRTELVHKLTSR